MEFDFQVATLCFAIEIDFHGCRNPLFVFSLSMLPLQKRTDSTVCFLIYKFNAFFCVCIQFSFIYFQSLSPQPLAASASLNRWLGAWHSLTSTKSPIKLSTFGDPTRRFFNSSSLTLFLVDRGKF